MLNTAIALATKAHVGQKDKGGNPYILHPLQVMLKMDTEDEMIVAVLHDVLEDTDVTVSDLLRMGFSSDIVEAIKSVTRQEGEKYFDFIERAKQNTIGRKVKIEDVIDNLDISRIPNPTERDYKRIKKYEKALLMLGVKIIDDR